MVISKNSLKYLLLFIILLEIVFYFTPFQKIRQSPQSLAQEFSNECSVADWRTCYGKKFAELVEEEDVKFALGATDKLQLIDNKTRDCHIIAHYIAIAAVDKNPSAWKEFIKEIDPVSCNYGYIHGMIEGLARYDPAFEVSSSTLPKICKLINDVKRDSGLDQGCAHIMGHLMLSKTCNKDIKVSVEKAVQECGKVNTSYQHECYAGIFMESFTRDNLIIHCNDQDIPWNEATIKNQEELCASYTGEAASSCWQEISHMYHGLLGSNPQLIFEACSKAPLWENTVTCYIHAASTLARKEGADREYLSSICAPFLIRDPKAYNRCTMNVESQPN